MSHLFYNIIDNFFLSLHIVLEILFYGDGIGHDSTLLYDI